MVVWLWPGRLASFPTSMQGLTRAWSMPLFHAHLSCRCPITLGIMKEPTQASSGVTYERSAIFQWLHIHRVDPVTHVPLKRHRLTPNLNLRQMIEDWVVKETAARAASKQGQGSGEGAAAEQEAQGGSVGAGAGVGAGTGASEVGGSTAP